MNPAHLAGDPFILGQLEHHKIQAALYFARLYHEFEFFAQEVWACLRLDRFAPIGEIELDVLRFQTEPGSNHKITLANRGFGKTYLGSAMLPCWDWFRDPTWKVVVVSKSDGFAKKIVRQVRNWLDRVPFLKHLAPPDGHRDAATYFDVDGHDGDKQPSLTSLGIDGQLEGNRAHRVIGDDVETKSNTKTLDARADLHDRTHEFKNIATYGDRLVNIFGTPHHEESVYLKMAAEGYAARTWPLLYPQPDDEILNLAPLLKGRLDRGEARPGDTVAPYRFSPEYVADQQATGRTNFAMQHQLIANAGDAALYPLRLADLVVFDAMDPDRAPLTIHWGRTGPAGRPTKAEDIPCLGFAGDALYHPILFDADWGRYTRKCMWVDPSGAGSDRTAIAIVGQAHGRLWAMHVEGLPGHGASQPNLAKIAQLAKQHRVHEIHVEDYGLQSMFAQLLEPVVREYHTDQWKCAVLATRPAGGTFQKEHRILDILEPVTQQHRLIVSRQVAQNETLQHQFTRITRQRGALEHEDELEALASCCGLFQDEMRQNPAKAAERARDRQIEEALRRQRQGMRSRPTSFFAA